MTDSTDKKPLQAEEPNPQVDNQEPEAQPSPKLVPLSETKVERWL